MDYISVKQASEKWKISERRIQLLCNGNRVDGIKKFGKSWMIPDNAKKPIDARIKSGKYVKSTVVCDQVR